VSKRVLDNLDAVLPKSRRVAELAARIAELKAEGLALFRPLPAMAGFHECRTKWRIIDGSNRSSKTLSGCVEDARAWCGCDPFDKYPRASGKSLVVTLDRDNIGMLWRKLRDPGEFKCIRDEKTGVLRAVRPDPNDPSRLDPYDLAYCEKWVDSPPLIPDRMLPRGSITWEISGVVPRTVKFATGWRVLFRSSGGAAKPPQGDNYDHGHIDEQIGGQDFFNELSRGLVQIAYSPRHIPRAYWTATSQVVDPNLLDLRDRADQGAKDVTAFKALIAENPFIPEEEKRAFWDSLSEEEREVRYLGHYAIHGRRVYGEYHPNGIHGCEPFAIPNDWCVYVVLDPGTQHCATLLAAVDPEEKHVWVYDGFDIAQRDATLWAETLAQHLQGRRPYALICDQQMGRQHTVGDSITVAQKYFEPLEMHGVVPETLGPLAGFFPGSNDVAAREQSLLGWLKVRGYGFGAGTPRLQVVKGCSPKLDKQMSRAAYDDKNPNQRSKRIAQDLVVCLEYLAAFDPGYHAPKPLEARKPFDLVAYVRSLGGFGDASQAAMFR